MSTKGQQGIPTPTSLPDKELQEARQVINSLILAWKNYGLYPEDHMSTIKSLENLAAAFGNFLTAHGNLRLTVEKDLLLCESEIIHEVSQEAPSEDIISLLYRDGIKWVEFQEGLTLEEIAAFLRIAYKYRLFLDETEGDIVTALMDEELEYIDFKAVDIFWQDLLVMDFSQLPAPAPQKVADQNETAQSQHPAEFDGKDIYARSIADPSISIAQLELTSGDHEILQKMVKEEESWGITEDLFELLLIILKSQTEQKKITEVLGFISEVAVETIELDKFDLLLKLFQSLHKLSSPETSTEQELMRPVIGRFSKELSKPQIFQLISEKLLQLQTSEIEKLKALGKALLYFSPEVVPFLMPVIMQRSSPEIQKMVSRLIVHLSRRDIGPLEKIAKQQGTAMGEKLLVILTSLHGERANEILFRMCDHSSDKVRRKAIRELVARNPEYAQRLFSLIDDPRSEIRTYILAAFAKFKSPVLENMMLNYLKGNYALDDPAHVLACYKALGRCASNISVPFLRKILMDQGWNSLMGSGKFIFREGAAIALALIATPEAKGVLQKASKSKFKVVREACDRSKAIIDDSGEYTND